MAEEAGADTGAEAKNLGAGRLEVSVSSACRMLRFATEFERYTDGPFFWGADYTFDEAASSSNRLTTTAGRARRETPAGLPGSPLTFAIAPYCNAVAAG